MNHSNSKIQIAQIGLHEEGILGMCVGEKRQLIIPSELVNPKSFYPGGATLFSDIELLKIEDSPAEISPAPVNVFLTGVLFFVFCWFLVLQ